MRCVFRESPLSKSTSKLRVLRLRKSQFCKRGLGLEEAGQPLSLEHQDWCSLESIVASLCMWPGGRGGNETAMQRGWQLGLGGGGDVLDLPCDEDLGLQVSS